MSENAHRPHTIDILQTENIVLSEYDNHIRRKLSAMEGQFLNQNRYSEMLAEGDITLYEVYEIKRPEIAGELLHGLSIVHPGKVGEEYFMTKGHFHTILKTAEIYYCLRGEGYMVMETPEGEWAVEPLRPNAVLYVPPGWAHRSVNTSPTQELVTFFVYPGNAGHNYDSIEKQGFRKLVIEREGKPHILNNPRWLPPEMR